MPAKGKAQRQGKQIAIIGAGEGDAATLRAAEEVGRLLARAGAVVVCGGLGGVMESACKGARKAGGVTVGILPGTEPADGNRYLDYAVCTGTGHARNLAVVASGDAVIAIGGGAGTLSEIGLALKIGRPVVTLSSWELRRQGRPPEGVTPVATPDEAVAAALAAAS